MKSEVPSSARVKKAPPKRLPILQLLALVAGIVVLAAGTLLFGQSRHAQPTGSLEGATVAVGEYYRLAGAPVDSMHFDVQISSVNDHWARFTASSVGPGPPRELYGYLEFQDHHWAVVATGTSDVGCRTAAASGTVPLTVIEGFGLSCPL